MHLDQTPAVSLRKRAAARTTAGRWSLLTVEETPLLQRDATQAAVMKARQTQSALESHARVLLCRYGVVFREMLSRESNAPKWRDLAPVLRRLEARGEIRGGRFVSGPFGEQFAVPEAAEGLREARRRQPARASEARIKIAAVDPLNTVGVLVPGERVPALPGREVEFCNGAMPEPVGEAEKPVMHALQRKPTRSVAALLRQEVNGARVLAVQPRSGNLELFS